MPGEGVLKSWTIATSRRYRYHGFLRSGHTIVLPDHTLGSISHPFGPFQPLSSSRGNQQDSPSDTHVERMSEERYTFATIDYIDVSLISLAPYYEALQLAKSS